MPVRPAPECRCSQRNSAALAAGARGAGEVRSLDGKYIAIDLKSFYASVECVERGLNPLKANLVVADMTRTEKTICLAVTPALKAYGISGRARLFEVIQRVREINAERRNRAPGGVFARRSADSTELAEDPSLELDFVAAPPRMAKYIEVSTRIYEIYLKYIAPEDIHVYSIDEVFIDASRYLRTYRMTARELAMTIIRDVLRETGITATVGIGTNLYLCKVAMDVEAKKMEADGDGVRIAELDEMSYRRRLWDHRPITDFWRVGRGYARRLASNGMYTMGDVAMRSIEDEALLYRLFGINAELLIDHAWGRESCTMEDIKAYRPKTSSLSSGQVLKEPYDYEKAMLVTREMAELMALKLADRGLLTDQLVLSAGYDHSNISGRKGGGAYKGKVRKDHYGRRVPESAHGTVNIGRLTSSSRMITDALMELYESIVDKELLIRRINIAANNIVRADEIEEDRYEQMDLFTDPELLDRARERDREELERESRVQRAVIDIKKKYGKNAIFRGMDLEEGATALERNSQIGGHKA